MMKLSYSEADIQQALTAIEQVEETARLALAPLRAHLPCYQSWDAMKREQCQETLDLLTRLHAAFTPLHTRLLQEEHAKHLPAPLYVTRMECVADVSYGQARNESLCIAVAAYREVAHLLTQRHLRERLTLRHRLEEYADHVDKMLRSCAQWRAKARTWHQEHSQPVRRELPTAGKGHLHVVRNERNGDDGVR